MKPPIYIPVVALIALSACVSSRQDSATSIPSTAASPPTATEVRILPTPSSPGDSVVWENLQVSMDELEITQEYITEFGSSRLPTQGNKFLWVHVSLKNRGPVELQLPRLENFSILYAASEWKPIYGHRAGYTDYSALGTLIFPDQDLDGWLRFDIPNMAELSELLFVFLPESAQIGTSYNSPNYPYATNKPTYVWNCE